MFRLLYASNCSPDMNNRAVAEILRTSRTNNAALGITGILVQLESAFIQILEGEKDAVMQTYSKIIFDPRHWNVHILLAQEAPRMFSERTSFHRLTLFQAKALAGPAITQAAMEGKLNTGHAQEVIKFLSTMASGRQRPHLQAIAS